MNKRIYVFFLLLLLMSLVSCVESYQRYLEALYIGGGSSDVFPLVDTILKDEGFALLDTPQKNKDFTITANFTRYDSFIQKRVRLGIYLKDSNENGESTRILFTVGSQGWEDATKQIVDKDFETLIDKMKTQLGAQLKIIKKSASG